MIKYCPSAKPIGTMKLPDYRLDFAYCKKNSDQGGCDLISDPGNIMYGILYELPQDELDELSILSGHGEGLWTGMDICLIDENGHAVPAQTYIIPTPGGAFRPSADYVKPILKGIDVLEVPDDYKNQVRQIIQDATGGE